MSPSTNSLPRVTQSVLYIYKSIRITCFTKHHRVIDVIASCPSIENKTVKLAVQYCMDCDKLLMSEDEFKSSQRLLRYHFIPARMQYIDEFHNYSYTDNSFTRHRADISPLRLSGYSTRRSDAIPQSVRQDILQFIIERRILTKEDVIAYLELFIHTNGLRAGMEDAVDKWKDDLHFVRTYDFNVQATAYVTSIRPYSKR